MIIMQSAELINLSSLRFTMLDHIQEKYTAEQKIYWFTITDGLINMDNFKAEILHNSQPIFLLHWYISAVSIS